MKIDTRERRRCDECRATFRIARDPEGREQVSCMRCCGLTPSGVLRLKRLRDSEIYETPPQNFLDSRGRWAL